ncbi:hypothetical protein [Alicyclobacillus sp.]|uniref:hypothetical protein n=1 Tax=Alicyclobacillus sp. TaxID=61169 RepID=UPI0025C08B7F|nr:hypothetical protein [Alicyclobacillus sp.]
MRRGQPWFTIEHLALWMWLVGFAVYQMHPYNDPDTPWHLGAGRYILQQHVVPTTDPFSWSAHGQPWVTQEWLFEVVFAWLADHLGFKGPWLLQTGIHTVTVLVLYRLCTRVSGGHRVMAALAAIAATLVPLIFWTMRPQMVSYMMFAVFLWLLQRVRDGSTRLLWLVPPLMWVWANAHGSSSIGIAMLLLEFLLSFLPPVGRFTGFLLPRGGRWKLLLAALGGFCAGLVNPNGIRAYTYALLSTNALMTDNIMEWHSPNFHMESFKYGLLPFLIVCFLVLLGRSRTIPWRETLYFGGCFAVALVYQRFIPYLCIAAAPLMARMLGDWLRSLLRPSRWLRAFNGVVMAGTLLYLLWFLPDVRGDVDQHMDAGAYPVAAVNWMLSHGIHGKLVNGYEYGGYLIYRGIPTFIDGRTDIYLQNSIFSDYLAIRNVWWNCPDLLKQYGFQVALFPSGFPVVTYLEHDPEWHVEFRGGGAELLVRNDARPAGA